VARAAQAAHAHDAQLATEINREVQPCASLPRGGAVVNSRVGQRLINVLAKQVRFIAFALRRDHQLSGFMRALSVIAAKCHSWASLSLHGNADAKPIPCQWQWSPGPTF